MSLVRETYYGALATRLQALQSGGTIKTFTRRLAMADEVRQAMQPALFMAQTYQTPKYAAGRQIMWNLGAVLYLYVHDPKNKTPGVLMNPIMDAITALFVPDNLQANACTFGGLCHHVEVGEIETDEGTLGEQSIARIPIDMLVVGSPI